MSVPWEIITAALGVLVTAGSLAIRRVFAVLDRSSSEIRKNVHTKFAALEAGHARQDKEIVQIRERIHEAELEMARNYVRWEEHARDMGTIRISITNIHDKIDRLLSK